MSDFPRWKYALVAVVLLFGFLYALPNVFAPVPAVQISANRGATIDDALKDKVEQALKQKQLAYTGISISDESQASGNRRMLVRFATDDVQTKAVDLLKDDLGSQYVVAPNLASTVPAWLQSIHANAMPLGLDLQGGVHFLLQIDQSGVLQQQEQVYEGNVRQTLRDKNIRYVSVSHNAKGVVAVLRSEADRTAATDAIGADYPDLDISNGPSTGNRFVLNMQIKPEKIRELAQNTIRQNLTTLRNRVNALGVSEPLIQQQGNSRIVVDLAGIQDTAQAKRILGAQASLEYRAGLAKYPDQRVIDAEKGIVPPNARLYHGKACPQGCLLSKQVIVTGDQLTSATPGFSQEDGSPQVEVTLNSDGARRMQKFTEANVGKPMAVVYIDKIPEVTKENGKDVVHFKNSERVISYATVIGVFGRQFSTTGLDSNQEAQNLALLLKAGSLAAPMSFVEQHVIGPSLGRDNIHKGVSAVILGLSLVLLAALIYYKLFGLVADIALVLNLVLLVAVMSMIGVTLTMPGIAGIVLTLGMAIDANVLICERIREELRNGSTPLASIRAGYEKAWATILDANVTHLLAAMALMTLGSGPIKGFGVTLFIGILTSLFTSVTVTHAITALLHGGKRKLKTLHV